MKKKAPLKKLHSAAEHIRKRGNRSDTVLAHINPQEAQMLHNMYGSDINPETGLPQFGLLSGLFGRKKTDEYGNIRRTGLRKAFHGMHGLEKTIRPVVKKAAPLAGTMIGSLFGGPMGGVLGGAIGGGLSSKKHPFDHALGGAMVGLLGSQVLPSVGSTFGVNPESTTGGLFGMQGPGLMEQLGFGGAGAASAGMAGMQAAPGMQEAASMGEEGGGAMDFAKSLGLKDMIDVALLGTSIAGSLGAKPKYKKQPGLAEMMQENMAAQGTYTRPKPLKRKIRKPPKDYPHGRAPQWQFFEEEENKKYAQGGNVNGGYIDGDHGGQSDTRPADIPEGSYVMDATTVSLLGDGNSIHGAEKVKKLEDSFLSTGITRDLRPSRNVKARVSDGEYILSKEAVNSIGKGDNAKGSKTLDKMRNKLRRQKGVKKFLPPKTKNLEHYMR